MTRLFVVGLALVLLSGCAISPPPPPQPQGDYHPVNRDQYLLKRMDGTASKPAQPISDQTSN